MITIAKRKPDQTVNIRLELQDFERQALASHQMASAIKDAADAIDKLTSFENLYILTTVAEMVTGKELLPGTPNDVYQLIDWLREWLKTAEPSEYFDTIPEGSERQPGLLDVLVMAIKKSTLVGNLL